MGRAGYPGLQAPHRFRSWQWAQNWQLLHALRGVAPTHFAEVGSGVAERLAKGRAKARRTVAIRRLVLVLMAGVLGVEKSQVSETMGRSEQERPTDHNRIMSG